MTEAPESPEKKRATIFGLIEITEFDRKSLLPIREASKWILDLIQYVIVVAVLQYAAQKSESIWVKALAFVSFLALAGYCSSYAQMWSARVDRGKTVAIRATVFILVSVVLVFVILGVSFGLTKIVEEVARTQGQ